jgi:hypothetical protein
MRTTRQICGETRDVSWSTTALQDEGRKAVTLFEQTKLNCRHQLDTVSA